MYRDLDEIRKAILGMDNITAEKFLNAEIKKVSSQLDIVLSKKEELLKENKSLRDENFKFKKSLEIFELSKADKVELEQQLDKAEKRIGQLAMKIREADGVIEKYVNELKFKCRKLNVQIFGMTCDLNLLERELSALSVYELKQKISILEEQLGRVIPVGRKSKETARVLKPEEVKGGNEDLFKFKM